MNRIRCPNCGFSYRGRVRYGDWIRDKPNYDAFWKDTPIKVKLAIEDYLVLKDRDPKKNTLNFTANHNEVEWPKVKKVFQELRASGFVYDSYL